MLNDKEKNKLCGMIGKETTVYVTEDDDQWKVTEMRVTVEKSEDSWGPGFELKEKGSAIPLFLSDVFLSEAKAKRSSVVYLKTEMDYVLNQCDEHERQIADLLTEFDEINQNLAEAGLTTFDIVEKWHFS